MFEIPDPSHPPHGFFSVPAVQRHIFPVAPDIDLRAILQGRPSGPSRTTIVALRPHSQMVRISRRLSAMANSASEPGKNLPRNSVMNWASSTKTQASRALPFRVERGHIDHPPARRE
jgi:hypothetical protein